MTYGLVGKVLGVTDIHKWYKNGMLSKALPGREDAIANANKIQYDAIQSHRLRMLKHLISMKRLKR